MSRYGRACIFAICTAAGLVAEHDASQPLRSLNELSGVGGTMCVVSEPDLVSGKKKARTNDQRIVFDGLARSGHGMNASMMRCSLSPAK